MHIYFCHCWKMISCLSLLSLIKIFRFLLSRIAECFAFLVCTKWFNPMIHREVHNREPGSSSNAIRYREWSSGLVLPSFEDQHQEQLCGLPDIGGHIMKVPLVIFQVLLCMHLEVIFLSQVWAFGQIFSLPIVYLFGQLCDFLHVIVNDLNLFFKTCCKVLFLETWKYFIHEFLWWWFELTWRKSVGPCEQRLKLHDGCKMAKATWQL